MSEQGLSQRHKLAHLLDDKFVIPGTNIRFGLDPLIGLLPGIGDWLTGVVALYYPFKAANAGAKPVVLFRMFLNIIFDLVVGVIPLLGEIFDFAWKANIRNAELLEELEDNPQMLTEQSKWLLWTILVAFVVVLIEILVLLGWLFAQLVELFI